MATAYWNNRAILRQAAYDRANNHTVATVSKAFDRTMRQLDIDIDKIMATYTRKTGLTARDAYQFLRDGVPAGVMDELRARAAAITDKTQAKRLGVMLRTDAYRARISRLDAIKASTRVGLSEAAEAELGAITPHLRHTADLAYTRTMFDIQKVTAGFQMVGVPSRALDTILKSKWSGLNYAQSVWANRDAMAGILDRALMEQASMGKLSQITFDNVRGIVDTQAWADKVAAGMKSKFRDEMQYSKYAANRLIRTESAYVANQTTAVAYDECEIEKYEFMATLDNRTSSICSSKDGEIYVTKDKEVGVNWPPLHPHCRSTTAPYIDGLVRENMTRAARDKDGKSVYVPRDMKYQEWKRWQDAGCPDVGEWRKANAPKPVKADPLYPESIAGVKRGESMLINDAGGRKPNPGYTLGGGYTTNCATCVPVYEARMRGYDVQALPNKKGSKVRELSGDIRKIWIDPNTGEAARIKRYGAKNQSQLYDFWDEVTNQDERYTIRFGWKGRRNSGHVIAMRKNISGKLELYDPQNGKSYLGREEFENYFSRAQFQRKSGGVAYDDSPGLIRIDDKAFNPEFVDFIMEAADGKK